MARLESIYASKWQARRQLRIEPLEGHVPPRWNVFDPLSRNSYRIGWLEHSLLRTLVRPTILADALSTCVLVGSSSRGEVEQALLQLQHCGLVYPVDTVAWPNERSGDEGALTAAGKQERANRWTGFKRLAAEQWAEINRLLILLARRLTGMLAIQVRGPNPERLLGWLAPRLDFLFSARAVSCWLTLALLTVLMVLTNIDQLSREVGSLFEVLQPATGGSLLLLVLLTRVAHELGHAIVATRHGVRCPDVGLYIFCGAPCLYCDVSESWLLTRRRQRAAVAAGGMYVELIIATLAAWLWLSTAESWLHLAAMKMMLVCSIGSLLVNLNPLLRFDGYYILADWLDEANLRQRADRQTLDCLRGWFHRKKPSRQLNRGRRWFYLAFSLSSFLFRLMLSLGMAWAIAKYLERWHMEAIGVGLAVVLLVSWWGGAIMSGLSSLTSVLNSRSRRLRAAWALVLVWSLMLIPLPVRHFAQGWVEPQQAIGVYAPEAGRLEAVLVTSGDQVLAGQTLFRLASSNLLITRTTAVQELADSEIVLRHAVYRQQVRSLPADHPLVNVDELQAHVVAARDQLTAAEDRLHSLQVVAPSAGKLLLQPVDVDFAASTAAEWNAAHLGRGVQKGDRLGVIVDDGWRVMIPLSAEQLCTVGQGTRVKLRFEQDPSSLIETQVKQVVALDTAIDLWRPDFVNQSDQIASSINQSSAATGVSHAAVVDLSLESTRELDLRAGCSVDAVFSNAATSLLERIFVWCRLHWPG